MDKLFYFVHFNGCYYLPVLGLKLIRAIKRFTCEQIHKKCSCDYFIWRCWARIRLVKTMACCLTAMSHYLNQCLIFINEARWHLTFHQWGPLTFSSVRAVSQKAFSLQVCINYILENTATAYRGQSVKFRHIPIHLQGQALFNHPTEGPSDCLLFLCPAL